MDLFSKGMLSIVNFCKEHPFSVLILTVIFFLLIFFIIGRAKRWMFIQKDARVVMPKVAQLRNDLAFEPSLSANFWKYVKAFQDWIEREKLQNHPGIYGHMHREVCKAFVDRHLIPPAEYTDQAFNHPFSLRDNEALLFSCWPKETKIKEDGTKVKQYQDGYCCCAVTTHGLYFRNGPHIEYIPKGDFTVLNSIGYGTIEVQRRQPPGDLYYLTGDPDDMKFILQALQTHVDKKFKSATAKKSSDTYLRSN